MAGLDKFDDVDIENIVVDGKTYNVNEKIEAWIKKYIFVRMETKRKKKRRTESKQTK